VGSKPKFPKSTQAILLIGSGKFHAISLANETELPVYIFNNHKLEKISEKDLESVKTKQKAAYLNFLNSSLVLP